MISPTVSILLPTYKDPASLFNAIESVNLQTFSDWELIIIDDGLLVSVKNSLIDIIKNNSKIRLISNENNFGIQKSLNRGLKESNGEYIARIDDDDIWVDRDKLKKQVEFLKTNESYVLVGTGAIVVDEKGKELFRYLFPTNDSDIRRKILSKNCFAHSGVLFKKKEALDFKGYDESSDTKHIEDYDLWLKLGIVGKFANLETYSVVLMERGDTITNSNRVLQAKRMVIEVFKFRSKYPNFFIGFIITLARLVFFLLEKIFPFNKRLINKLKVFYKK